MYSANAHGGEVSGDAGSPGESDAVIEDPGGEAGTVVVLERLGGEEVKLNVIAGLVLNTCGDLGPVGKAPCFHSFDEDRQIDVTPLVRPPLDL